MKIDEDISFQYPKCSLLDTPCTSQYCSPAFDSVNDNNELFNGELPTLDELCSNEEQPDMQQLRQQRLDHFCTEPTNNVRDIEIKLHRMTLKEDLMKSFGSDQVGFTSNYFKGRK